MPLDPRCTSCGLSGGRRQVVPPSGDLNSCLVLLGEAPGEREDKLGQPFVGRAGKWLDKCLADAQLPREKIMITNTVKCRPPDNRRPEPEEVEACMPHLMEDLKGRGLVVALGSTAIEALLGKKVKVGEVANQIVDVDFHGLKLKVLLTYHPSACIYNRDARVKLAEGLRMAKEYCGITA
ncbi:MAG: Uracil DNA glycosylase superfamily protein [Methanomassiliicoccales archaeon PtaU1.Bin124]|nr:MAG: Uracil DNA glycosylase superfamily protein [Methanomassiliicoccales archaeon PtaU1.Bin124]